MYCIAFNIRHYFFNTKTKLEKGATVHGEISSLCRHKQHPVEQQEEKLSRYTSKPNDDIKLYEINKCNGIYQRNDDLTAVQKDCNTLANN